VHQGAGLAPTGAVEISENVRPDGTRRLLNDPH
jgi:hypothetical protein